MTGRTSDETGFTLVELVLSVAILTIIISAITGSMITYLQNGQYTIERDDHSGGAVILSTYLNRDFASADAAPTTTATPCTGTGTSNLNLAWTEWTASTAQPSPAPTGGNWKVSYVATTDDPAVGGGTRYKLTRRLCKPDGTSQDTLLLRSLRATSASAVLTLASVSSTDCPEGRVAVGLAKYGDDVDAQKYQFTGCLKGRVR